MPPPDVEPPQEGSADAPRRQRRKRHTAHYRSHYYVRLVSRVLVFLMAVAIVYLLWRQAIG